MLASRRRLGLIAGGLLLLQAVWILTVPPFRASDEFDHVYRAAGVARGEVLLTEPAKDGRGLYVTVPADIGRAAQAQCASLDYTGHENCHPAAIDAAGNWTLATASGWYNPIYYWWVGTVALPFEGTGALYAMRAAGALLCSVLLLIAVAIALSQRGGRWESLGLLIALTPVLTFSTAVAAPNGLEMAAGLLTWTSLLALARNRRPELTNRYLAAAATGAGLLAQVRMLGPLWLCLIVAVVLTFAGWRPWRNLWLRAPRPLLAAAASAFVATVGGLGWVVVSGWYAVGEGSGERPPELVALVAKQSVTWILQLTAAFPYRDVVSPLVVYPAMLILVVTALVVACRRGTHRERLALGGAVILTVAAPAVLTFLTAASQGVVWQGRYALAFVVGIVPLCGIVLDRTQWAPREGARLAVIASTMVMGIYVLCIHRVVVLESLRGAQTPELDWAHPPALMLDVMVVAAVAAMALGLGFLRPRTEVSSGGRQLAAV